MYQKPAIFVHPQDSPFLQTLDTDFYAPATPPLSSCGSNISSPLSSYDLLPTPVNAFFPGESIEGVKQGCEGEVFAELLSTGAEWRSTTPPMTPGKFDSKPGHPTYKRCVASATLPKGFY